jgi:hypothetical protein
MKKILCLFGAMTLVLASCSSDNSSDVSNDILLKKMISTDKNGNVRTTNYTYDGNKIVSSIDDSGDSNMFFTYTGDLITKIEFKFPDGTVEQIDTYTYDSKKRLVKFNRSEADGEHYEETYTHNDDGSINVYVDDHENGKITFLNGEVSKVTSSNSPSHSYTYDSKKNVQINVLGQSNIAYAEGNISGISHNVISSIDLVDENYSDFMMYEYDANDFPIKIITKDNNDEIISTDLLFY